MCVLFPSLGGTGFLAEGNQSLAGGGGGSSDTVRSAGGDTEPEQEPPIRSEQGEEGERNEAQSSGERDGLDSGRQEASGEERPAAGRRIQRGDPDSTGESIQTCWKTS